MKVEASRFSVHQPRAGLLLRDAAAGGDRRLCCAWKWIWPEERHLSFPVSCRDFLVLHSGGLPWALKTILNRETSIVTLGACSLCRAQTPLRIYFLSLLFSYLSKIASADSLTDTVSLAVTIISPQLFLLGRQWCYWCLQKKKQQQIIRGIRWSINAVFLRFLAENDQNFVIHRYISVLLDLFIPFSFPSRIILSHNGKGNSLSQKHFTPSGVIWM